jgi:hypothetical protein
MARRAHPPRPLPWRGIGFYFLILTFMGVALGIIGEVTDWSEGLAFAAAVVVGAPISLSAALDAINWLQGSHEEGRPSRPSSG